MTEIEAIVHHERVLAYIVRWSFSPETTEFVTPAAADLQLGFVVYSAGLTIPRHLHLPVDRRLTNTSEAIMIRRGRCQVDMFDDDKSLVATRELAEGDIILFLSGGHGFRTLEDTVLVEIKQGPYTGLQEKERF